VVLYSSLFAGIEGDRREGILTPPP